MVIEHKKVKYGHDPRTFSGLVYFKDFFSGSGNKGSDDQKGSEYANRVAYDLRFDQNCQRKPVSQDWRTTWA